MVRLQGFEKNRLGMSRLNFSDPRHYCRRREREAFAVWMPLLGMRVHLVLTSLSAFRRRRMEPSMDIAAVARIHTRTSPRHLIPDDQRGNT